jgi:hypothetical protein
MSAVGHELKLPILRQPIIVRQVSQISVNGILDRRGAE